MNQCRIHEGVWEDLTITSTQVVYSNNLSIGLKNPFRKEKHNFDNWYIDELKKQ